MLFADIAGPAGVDAFLVNSFGREVVHFPGSPGRFAVLDDPAAVTRLTRDLERQFEAGIFLQRTTAFEPSSAELLLLFTSSPAACEVHRADALLWTGTLGDGDALYLPRGCRVTFANSDPEPAPHFAFEIESPTGLDLLAWILRRLGRNHPFFETAVPRFAPLTQQADYLDQFREAVRAFLDQPGLLESFRQRMNVRAPVSAPDKPADIHDHSVIEMASPRRLRIYPEAAGTVSLRLSRQTTVWPVDAVPLLTYLDANAPVTVAKFRRECAAELGESEWDGFLHALLDAGVIVVRGHE